MGAPSLQNRHADRWEVRGPARCVMPSRSRGLEPTVATCTSDPFRTSYIHLNNGTQREGAYLDMYSRSWHEASKAYLLEGILFCISARFGTSQRARSPYLGPTIIGCRFLYAKLAYLGEATHAKLAYIGAATHSCTCWVATPSPALGLGSLLRPPVVVLCCSLAISSGGLGSSSTCSRGPRAESL